MKQCCILIILAGIVHFHATGEHTIAATLPNVIPGSIVSDGNQPVITASNMRDILGDTPVLFVSGAAPTDTMSSGYTGTSLCALAVTSGTLTVSELVECPEGLIRDPAISFDGSTVAFAMKRNYTDTFHLYAFHINNRTLTQLTCLSGVDDSAPVFIPGGDIVFSSTRDHAILSGSTQRMPHLYRMRADGANIHRIGAPGVWEDHPRLLPDGRILYERIDIPHIRANALWTMNPDGTNHMLYWRDETQHRSISGTHPIGGTGMVACMLGHIPIIIDRESDLSGYTPLATYYGYNKQVIDSLPAVFETIYPINDRFMLCSARTSPDTAANLYLVGPDGFDLLWEQPSVVHGPVLIRPHIPSPAIHTRRTYDDEYGSLYILNAYHGEPVSDVIPGTITSLRIIEIPVNRTQTQSQSHTATVSPRMGWNTHSAARILGNVPVEKDGSAYFSLPAERMISIQLLDYQGEVHSEMATPVMVQPGETTGCVGCHDNRAETPPIAVTKVPLALIREPSQPTPNVSMPVTFDFMRDIQPIFTQHCLRCHGSGAEAARSLNLSPHRTIMFNVAYEELCKKQLIPAEPGTYDARYHKISDSTLTNTLRAGHQGIRLDPQLLELITTWIECGTAFYETAVGEFPDHPGGRSPLSNDELLILANRCGLPLYMFTEPEKAMQSIVDFDFPHESHCLAGVDKSTPAYTDALELITLGSKRLSEQTQRDRSEYITGETGPYHVGINEIESRFRSAIDRGEILFDGISGPVEHPPGARQ